MHHWPFSTTRWVWDILLGGCLAGMLSCVPGVAADLSTLTAVPQDGCNLVVREVLSPSTAVLGLSPATHGWFAGTFTHLPTDHPVTLGFTLDGSDDPKAPADAAKWRGLRTVMSYADPTCYDSYVSYRKRPDGHWISDDPFRSATDPDAGTGVAPEQSVIPAALADQFLSPDGVTWIPWRDVDQVRILSNINIVRLTQQFAQPTATVAMRVPFTYTYLQAYVTKLQDAHRAGVTVDHLGNTPDGRALTVIRLEPPEPTTAAADRPTILIYAREHATEPDGSWVVDGVLQWLLSTTPDATHARQQANWLLIPLLDPDASAQSRYTNALDFLQTRKVRPETLAYARYFIRWIDAGHRIDVAVNLHNVECTEGPHIFIPLVNERHRDDSDQWNQAFFAALATAGFMTGRVQGNAKGYQNDRLAGWCAQHFATFDLAYELNSRMPGNLLTLPRLRQIGTILGMNVSAYLQTPAYLTLKRTMVETLTRRQTQQTPGTSLEKRTAFDLLILGY